MSVMDYTIKIYLFSFFFIVNWTKALELNSCMGNASCCMSLTTCGYTVPSGDITLEYGSPLSITCHLYPNSQRFGTNGKNASSILYFQRGTKHLAPYNSYDILNEREERVEVLNSTSIRLTIRKPEKMKENFYCYCGDNKKKMIACTNIVIVGQPPQNITDFSCKSYNWEYMTCEWTPPDNYVVTTYNVTFRFPVFNMTRDTAAILRDDSGSTRMNFTFAKKVPFYRAAQKIYEFYIHMNNTFGTNEQKFVWHHYENIYLKPPQNLTGKSISPSEIQLSWKLLSPLPVFDRDFMYRIMYKCEKFCNSWKLGGLYVPKKVVADVTYNLTNLEYAHEWYDVRVSMKVEEGLEETWSANSGVIVQTDSKIPDYPPPVTLGSFQIVDSQPKQVYVYFQQIRPEAENGDDFGYDVKSYPNLQMVELTSAFAKFVGLEDGTQYRMQIRSKNKVGPSTKSSVITIPSNRVKEPHKLWKIVHTSVKYELEWQQPRNTNHITNYTIFWCEHQTDRPYQCTGFLNWTVVPKSVLKYNVTVPPSSKVYQFAIAANSVEGSSGMLWASCTILANRTVLKINELIVKSVGSNFIELNWRQDCPDLNSEVTGYVIYYCATDETFNDNCTSPMKNVTIRGRLSDQSATVYGLSPYTTYLLAVSVKTKSTVGARSDFVRNVTSDAAPSTPPLNITFGPITNSSVTVHWVRPKGRIKYYYIYYNGNKQPFDGKLESAMLENLESYKEYVISMQACTALCSEASENLTVTTKMGIPDKPDRPYLNDSTASISYISWNKPRLPRGEIKYYQILITHQLENATGDIRNGTNEELYQFEFESCGAKSKYNNYATYIRVRAVNVIENEHYPGPWSDPYQMSSCYHNSWLVIYIVIGVLALILLAFGARKMYTYYRIMQDLEVKLPPGLAPVIERSEKSLTDIDRYGPDEELLLEEKTSEKCPAGDSSGCSSGQESITSSVESAAHLSIDSGTDQPRNVTDDNKENSLRLRNVSSKGYVMNDPNPTINRGTKTAPTGSYCKLGMDPSSKTVPDAPYVTISEIENMASPYVSPDKLPLNPAPYTDFFKTPNPGYVPFANPEPANKNTGYVLAGDLTSPVVEKNTELLLKDVKDVRGETLKPTVWQQPKVELSLTKPGYVSVGDASPPVIIKDVNKGYVPHRQFESKALKED